MTLRLQYPLRILCRRLCKINLPYARPSGVIRSLSDASSTDNTHHSPGKTPKLISKKFWTLPNVITISRICGSPVLLYAIANDMKAVALVGCIAGGFSDWLDGYIAKNHNQMSIWGGVLDPIADKVFIGCIAGGLTLQGLFPTSLLCIFLGRDIFLITLGALFRAIERPSGAPFFDSDTATFEIIPTKLSKINTALQFTLLGGTLSHFALDFPMTIDHLMPLWYLTGTTTVLSFFQYLDGTGMKRISTDFSSKKRFTWK